MNAKTAKRFRRFIRQVTNGESDGTGRSNVVPTKVTRQKNIMGRDKDGKRIVVATHRTFAYEHNTPRGIYRNMKRGWRTQ